ncbi:MAG TPA: enoyl-CoA hydratase-related protein [Solirubrobacterales bacterium]|jgi:enoyl-CoA hydratase/carnithine racemase
MGDAPVTAERHDAVELLRLNRPRERNALSPELMAALADELERADADPEARCIVIAGTDEVFASGADVRVLPDRNHIDDVLQPSGAEFWRRVTGCRTPLIAAVSGYALGPGFELALACDMVVASESAAFGQPEITLGMVPGGGATQRLTRTLGKQRAMELILTGRRINAQTAERWGLVNRISKRRAWLADSLELAAVVSLGSPLAAQLAKQAVRAAEETGLSAGLEEERRLHERAMASEDRVEGVTAFLEQRRPRFSGR